MNYLRSAVIGLLALAALLVLSESDTAHASTFNPTASAAIGTPEEGTDCFNDTDDDGDGEVNDGCAASAGGIAETGAQCNNNVDDDGDTLINDGCPVVGDTSPGAAAGLTTSFGVDAPDAFFGTVIGFTPAEFVRDVGANVPVGAIVGSLSSVAVLGLINGACDTRVPVDFVFMNATTGGATIDPKPPGQFDPLEFFLDDDDGNGIPNGVDRYPSYLNLLLDPDYDGPGPDGIPGTGDDDNGPKPPLVPKARYTGITFIATASISVVLSFVVFDPGTTFETDPPITTDSSLGFPSLTVLQDPTAPLDPSAITDFCSPLPTRTVLFGTTEDNPQSGAVDEGGFPFRVNPAEGAYKFVTFAVSLRDPDNDGHENGLDPCPFTPDPDWDPRLPTGAPGYAGDNDIDGIPNSCDPTPDKRTPTFAPIDHDTDGFLNRGDNCPLIANGEDEAQIAGVGVQLDSDGDGIGDACDTVGAGGIGLGPDEPDGHRHALCLDSVVIVGAPGGVAIPPPLPPCSDSDSDDVFDITDNCPAWANADQSLPPWPVPADDPDCDGFASLDERIIYGVGPGSDQELTPCRTVTVDDPWPPDIFGPGGLPDRLVDSQDMVALLPGLFRSVGQEGYSARLDIFQPGSIIDSQDLVVILPFLFRACTS